MAQYDHAIYMFESPSGMWIALRPHFPQEGTGWRVRVLNFATFKHQVRDFPDEAAAHKYALLWRI